MGVPPLPSGQVRVAAAIDVPIGSRLGGGEPVPRLEAQSAWAKAAVSGSAFATSRAGRGGGRSRRCLADGVLRPTARPRAVSAESRRAFPSGPPDHSLGAGLEN